ncbi:MAG TPA: nucleotidyltransferase domain-containing protein, partial [Pseudobdellovibrionaceae bacterium]
MSSLSKLNRNRTPPFDGIKKASELVHKLASEMALHQAYLFGSAANNEHTLDSDLDILVVVESTSDIAKLYKIVQRPFFSSVAVDWIVKSRAEFSKMKDVGGVCFVAFH